MNAAELHLVVNHIPLFASFFGILSTFSGYLTNNKGLLYFGLMSLMAGGIAAFIANSSGEQAEELIEHLPGISRKRIHAHEETAEAALVVSSITGLFALVSTVGLVLQWQKVRLLVLITCIVALLNVASMAKTAYEGGKIMHPDLTATTAEKDNKR